MNEETGFKMTNDVPTYKQNHLLMSLCLETSAYTFS